MHCSTPGFPVLHYIPVCSKSCPLSQWCHPTILSSYHLLLLLPSIFPSIRVFSNELTLHTGGQSIGTSALSSVLPMNIDLRLTCLISLLSKGPSRVCSSTTVQKRQFFGAQPSLWSNSHIHTWLLEKLYTALTIWTSVGKASLTHLCKNMPHLTH